MQTVEDKRIKKYANAHRPTTSNAHTKLTTQRTRQSGLFFFAAELLIFALVLHQITYSFSRRKSMLYHNAAASLRFSSLPCIFSCALRVGQIPESLGHLSALTVLSLKNNSLTGLLNHIATSRACLTDFVLQRQLFDGILIW